MLQDWLDDEFYHLHITVEDIRMGRTWLRQMGNAASKAGLNMLYCMAPPRTILQGLEIPALVVVCIK